MAVGWGLYGLGKLLQAADSSFPTLRLYDLLGPATRLVTWPAKVPRPRSALQGEAKERFNEIQQELSQLSTKFSNNVLDATKVGQAARLPPCPLWLALGCCVRLPPVAGMC